MKSRLLIIPTLAIGVAAGLGTGGGAVAAAGDAVTTVTITAEGTDLSGTVASPRPKKCAADRLVVVFKQKGTRGGGDDVRFASDRASPLRRRLPVVDREHRDGGQVLRQGAPHRRLQGRHQPDHPGGPEPLIPPGVRLTHRRLVGRSPLRPAPHGRTASRACTPPREGSRQVAVEAGPTSSALRRVLVPLALAQFICSFAGSNMNVMINDISEDLDTTVQGVQIAITIFLLVMAALMIPGGKLTDRYGRKRLLHRRPRRVRRRRAAERGRSRAWACSSSATRSWRASARRC